ncbi:hypothetical protein CD33_13190 [Ureibacillus sinduriensis BLB-1 = JCM 15800]|uniref:Uncharacterized protein n=1 Tax=Ureibacillus sinduriensis BLB-1 = JCM 15800 TaxID=1384057 RepID=A0A0A3HVF3_9BACL|nr:hypothetical protein CD33_13190 [Ureibacillus sinduriensis BLB-1 = JCM 15800]
MKSIALVLMETAGVEPASPRKVLTAVFTRVFDYFKNSLTTLLTTFNKNTIAGAIQINTFNSTYIPNNKYFIKLLSNLLT